MRVNIFSFDMIQYAVSIFVSDIDNTTREFCIEYGNLRIAKLSIHKL